MTTFRDLLDKSLRRTKTPTSEPLTVAEAKAHCSVPVDVTNFDDQFRDWIQSAREMVETDSERCLMSQEWELAIDRFPSLTPYYSGNLSQLDWNGRLIELRRVPVIQITSFGYWNTSSVWTPLAENTDYLLNPAAEPGVLTPASAGWPQMVTRLRGVVITWTAGYSSASAVPGMAKQAMRMLIAHWWRNREAVGERPNRDHDRAYDSLIHALRWRD